jgi:hypothetical protein
MVTPERIYRGSVRALSLAFVLLGAAILASALANGAGPASVGVVLGVAFLLVGVGRLWVSARMSR